MKSINFTFPTILFFLTLHFIACNKDPVLPEASDPKYDDPVEETPTNDANGANDGSSSNDGPPNTGMFEISASAEVIQNEGFGIQQWDEGVTLEAISIDGTPGQIAYDTQFDDHGFGVKGARWDQIDYYEEYQGQVVNKSERIIIHFNEEVSYVTLIIGMLGLDEGNGEDDETGKWIALGQEGNIIASGAFGPDESALGKAIKIGGYGQYPIDIDTNLKFHSLAIEATGFGYNQGEPKNVNSYENESGNKENNSDFNIMGVKFRR